MTINRRILAGYSVLLLTLLAAVAIKNQSLGFGKVLEAKNTTIMTHTQKPAVSCGVQGCTNTGVGHPTHGGIKGAGGGVITVP